MLKIDLENKINELNSKIFDLESKICELEEFEKIGDEKLLKAYDKLDKKIVIINQVKKLLNNKQKI